MKLKIIGLLLTVVALQGCSTKKNAHLGNKIMWVSGFKTECDAGAGKSECLVVSKIADLEKAKWENFYTPIEGFEFEKGFVQKIEVKTIELSKEELVADRSSLRYVLVKVIEKKKDSRWDLQGDWTLNKINGVETKKGDRTPFLMIDLTKKQFSGSDGCNTFSAIIQDLNANSLQLKQAISTLKACIDMSIADQFNQALATIDGYKVDENTLLFYNKEKQEVLSFDKKIVSKADRRIHDIWVAIKINGTNMDKKNVNNPRLELNLTTMQVFGNNGCNSFTGKITSVTDKNIALSPLASTRKMCQDMDLPNSFDKALQNTATYKFENLHLTFYSEDGKELITFLKVD